MQPAVLKTLDVFALAVSFSLVSLRSKAGRARTASLVEYGLGAAVAKGVLKQWSPGQPSGWRFWSWDRMAARRSVQDNEKLLRDLAESGQITLSNPTLVTLASLTHTEL